MQTGTAARYAAVRARTAALAAPLTVEDCALQSMPDASPVKWHLGHTTWFFETFVLERALPRFAPFRPEFRMLFNSYYVGVGPRHPRPDRGLLSRPSLQEVMAYRASVDERMQSVLGEPKVAGLIELGMHHEQQHQELILTDVKHLLSRNPLHPKYADASPTAGAAVPAMRFREFPEGVRQIGHEGNGFCFDNETPRHRVYLRGYAIADRLVTNREYREFMDDGGYQRPELWLAEGWDACKAQGWCAPLYWSAGGGQFTLQGMRPVEPDEPVTHVSFYEAEAFARWAGARLPGEAEWEIAAEDAPRSGNFLEGGRLHPAPGAPQFFGDAWEWTTSTYGPYPGFRAAEGAVGEYNGKFMVNQYVLRGGSCATPASHIRASYRNFFPAAARWQFSGIRLARDA
jgi:ergothioneine biosynthesis protein EgtB